MDVKAFVQANKDKLDARELAVLNTEINAGRTVAWVSEDLERALFTWELLGYSTRQISETTQTPEPFVIMTKLKYDWATKRKTIVEANGGVVSKMLQETTMQVFALTRLAIAKDHQEVMAGTLDPRKSAYVPKSTAQLKDLLEVIQEANAIEDEEPVKTPSTTVNILVQQQQQPATIVESCAVEKPIELSPQERKRLWLEQKAREQVQK